MPSECQLNVAEEGVFVPAICGGKFAYKVAVTSSLAMEEERFLLRTDKSVSIPAFGRQIREKPGAGINLINHSLVPESRDAELEGFIEERPGDGSRLWLMHHHDRAALVIEL